MSLPSATGVMFQQTLKDIEFIVVVFVTGCNMYSSMVMVSFILLYHFGIAQCESCSDSFVLDFQNVSNVIQSFIYGYIMLVVQLDPAFEFQFGLVSFC